MMGIHWRMDGQEGLLLGEMAGVRILQQVRERTHIGRLLTKKGIPYILHIYEQATCINNHCSGTNIQFCW